MHFDTDGIYTLQYTAEDSCGNETVEERTVEVIALHTTLFTDGTLIINEKSTDRDANIALHGAMTNEYVPLDSMNGYDFHNNDTRRPWYSMRTSIKYVEMGSGITPKNMSAWFKGCTSLETFDFSLIDTSENVALAELFYDCSSLVVADLSDFTTPKVTSFANMFRNCSNVTVIDISAFTQSPTLSSVGHIESMFDSCSALTTIYGNSDIFYNVPNKSGCFYGCISLVGGAGTTYNTNRTSGTYARIDNPPDAPGYFTAKA